MQQRIACETLCPPQQMIHICGTVNVQGRPGCQKMPKRHDLVIIPF